MLSIIGSASIACGKQASTDQVNDRHTPSVEQVSGTRFLRFHHRVLAVAMVVMSAAMVGIAIATAFERQYGVLKRIGTTPLGRPRLLVAKVAAGVPFAGAAPAREAACAAPASW